MCRRVAICCEIRFCPRIIWQDMRTQLEIEKVEYTLDFHLGGFFPNIMQPNHKDVIEAPHNWPSGLSMHRTHRLGNAESNLSCRHM